MIEIDVDRGALRRTESALFDLSGRKMGLFLTDAARRAAIHGKKIGCSKVRKIYTIDNYSIKRAIGIYGSYGSAMLSIVGKRVSVGHYKAKARKTNKWWKKDIFVSIKKGSGGVVSRAYAYSNTFWRRDEGDNYFGAWGNRMFGPAVPQLFENRTILKEITDAATQKYEERMQRNIRRLIGG